MEKGEYSEEEIAKKFGIDLGKLIAEQKKLSKLVKLKDEMDFSVTDTIAGCAN